MGGGCIQEGHPGECVTEGEGGVSLVAGSRELEMPGQGLNASKVQCTQTPPSLARAQVTWMT
jgi:hypothetical protein